MSSKPSNPKDSVGVRKAPASTVPAHFVLGVGLAMLEGGRKYGRHNYRVVGVRASVYYDAAIRHLMAWWEGEDIDPDSGLPHLLKAAACMAVVEDARVNGLLEDDRPPELPKGWLADLNAKAGEIIDRYQNPLPAYTRRSPEKPQEATQVLRRLSGHGCDPRAPLRLQGIDVIANS